MKISFNPTGLIANNVTNAKIDFVNNYGTYSNNYDDLTSLGEQKKTWFYFILIISLILTGMLFHISREEKDANGNVIEKTTAKKIYKILAWIFLGISIIFIIYSGYMYFFVYSPQYNEWVKSLPVDAQQKLNIIKNLNRIVEQAQSQAQNYNQSIINIS
jgi:hypothetical protein